MPHDYQRSEAELAELYGYQPPVSRLLTLGEEPLRRRRPDYRHAMGIREEHLAELARMTQDPAFLLQNCGYEVEAWAPIHAMRAMIQLGTEATLEPLVKLLDDDACVDNEEVDEWAVSEIPQALTRFGARAIPHVAALLGDPTKHHDCRTAAAEALWRIGRAHPQTSPECVRLLVEQLEQFSTSDADWNAWLIHALVALEAAETAPLIQRAFAAGMVDETVIGDWEEVQVELGLRPPLTAEECAEKARRRRAAYGGSEFEDDEELDEELDYAFDDEFDEELDDWDNPQSRLTDENADDDELDQPHDPPRLFMPEDVYTANERRDLAKQRHKERKAAERAKARQKQNKKRR